MLWFSYFLAVVNATIIGLSFLFVKIAVTDVSPIDTLSFRFIAALIFCVVYMKVMNIPLRIEVRRLFPLLLLTLFYPLGFFTFQAYGLLYTASAEAGILTATAPIITAVCAALFIGEKTNLLQFLSILISITGVMLLSIIKGVNFDTSNIAGIVLILLSCFMSAGYTITNRVLIRSFTAMEITLVIMIVGSLFFTVFSFVTHIADGTFVTMFKPLGNRHFIIAILYLGIFSSMLTTIFSSLILKHLRASELVVFLNFSTIVAIIAGYVFMRETIYSYHLIAAALIIIGVLGTNFFAKKETTSQ
ncbi:MAG: DMT family transporter [Planctomycetaceae bacterium]|jgi:drug/metabolite transporter (DMT)-like permease|nr:DMT family transporter [Planctomycetaceae bacterium]